MAGFFKKMFSFGRAEPEPEKTAEIAQQLTEAPVDAAALPDFLKSKSNDGAPANESPPKPVELPPANEAEELSVGLSPFEDSLDVQSFELGDGTETAASTPTSPSPASGGIQAGYLPAPPDKDAVEQEQPSELEPPADAPLPGAPRDDLVFAEPVAHEAAEDTQAETPAPASISGVPTESASPTHQTVEPEPAPAAIAPSPSQPATRISVGKTVERRPEAEPAAEAPAPRVPWFQRLRDGLSRSSRELSGSIAGVFTKKKLDEETLQDLEDVLIRADLGVETAMRITDTLSSTRLGRDVSDAEVRAVMAAEIEKVLKPVAMPLELDLSHKPHVVLVVGVNGTGKTTTIGKLAAKLTAGGLKVTLAAGDTFRAAAIEQLKIWGERTGSDVVSSKLGADAAGLAWDAYEKAKASGSDVLIIDTAGRLQNKAELMAELEKIVRVLGRHDPEAPHTVLQTVDATTGQNALNQVEIFRNIAGVNGLVMTKLDGTARGGILVGIAAKHRLPVYFIGVGEQVDDLEPFSASDFAKAIAGV